MSAILPGQTVGILGGGQLGKMIAVEARRLGYRVCVLDPDPACPAGQVADVVVGAWSDPQAALALAARADVITLETEHIPYQVLEAVEVAHTLRPSSKVLHTIQDRLNQRHFLHRHGLPQTRWAPVGTTEELHAAVATLGTPCILKRRLGGYDGRAQARILSPDQADAAFASLEHAPCVLEAFVHYRAELSVVLARSTSGEIRYFETAENVHVGGILHTTVAPARLPVDVRNEAEDIATAAAVALDIVGVLAVEFFLTEDGDLLINEMAPRVHNSGHYTLGACVTSQFEQHLRAVCGLPLGDQHQHQPAAMLNILGDVWQTAAPDWTPTLAEPRAHLHLYGKRDAKVGRKMGHITVLAQTTDEALGVVERLHAGLTAR